MENIVIIGAGNIGSRHLQALKSVNKPLNISVVDPNPESLNIAKQRYNSMPSIKQEHIINYIQKISYLSDEITIAIIATTSNIRRAVIEELLKQNNVKYMILEKLLFQKSEDFNFIKELFQEKDCKAWVNCTRRIIPAYRNLIKKWFHNKKIYYSVSGSNFGFITNIIHDIDYMAYLLDNKNFKVNVSYLDPTLIPSNRKGFFELTGNLQISFNNGSLGQFLCYPSGTLPHLIEICSENIRCFINQVREKSWVWNAQNNMKWESFDAKLMNTSQLTTTIVENLLSTNICSLTTYEDSMEIHLAFLNPILEFINTNSGQKFSYFPFT
jgi:predicted dehydrogenase